MSAGDDPGQLLVLQHATATGPDQLVPVLEARASQRPWRLVALDREPVPELSADVRGLLVLGGPMGVHDRDEHPWIDDELALLRSALDRDVPILGICLGAQLLATAAGGEVTRRDRPEVGVFPLQRTEAGTEDDIFAGWPDGGHVVLSHQDQVTTLPADSVPMLAGSGSSAGSSSTLPDGVPAWRLGDGGHYAVQFHPEVGGDGIAGWVARDELRAMYERADIDPDALVADVRRREAFLRGVGVSLVGRWLDGVVGADDPGPRRSRG
ncbi:MAG: type 1 glutamine amidotransferase [Actinobacteria bacterium]|nr:type 1 glutamine amidotransferase [Actinomycetota bacterium]